MKPDVLIAVNGYKESLSVVRFGAWLAAAIEGGVTLLGITEGENPAAIDDHHPLEDVFAESVAVFEKAGMTYQLEVQQGEAEKIIAERLRGSESILVVGHLGRSQFRHLISGHSLRGLMESIPNPMVYVPAARMPVKKVLVCIGGLGYEMTAEHLAMRAAIKDGAEITLLHIVPPMDLDYPTARTVQENWQRLAETDTPVGRSLRASLEIAAQEGLRAVVKARQGNVVEEILNEARAGNYDLICMGSPFSANSLRQMVTPNITAEVAESVQCPVLLARFKR